MMLMKKITFNALLNHKAHNYKPMQIEVEKVIPLYGKRFEQMRNHLLDDCPEIIENRELMYMEGNTAHCILFLDANGNDGILVEAEGPDYARKLQFIPNPYMFTDAQTKNSTDLMIWARQAYENGWGYVYGTYGNILTEELLQDRASMFGEHVTGFEDFIRENWMRRRTADCVGLIKGYGWYNPDSGEIVVGSNGMADVTANGMFDAATVKGTIDTIPETPGLAVWQDGHIGIYIGNGEVIEAMGTEQGVVKTTLPSGWTHWLEIP